MQHRLPDELEETFFALRACTRLLSELDPPSFAVKFSTVQEFAMPFKYLTGRMSDLVEQLVRESAGLASGNSAADTTAVVSFIARLSESLKRTLH
jgi:hypothetical protein